MSGCGGLKGTRAPCQSPSWSQLVPWESSSKWKLCLRQREPVGLAASRDGHDAEHRQWFCFPTCPWTNAACTGPLHSGFCTFPMCTEVSKAAAAFLAGLTVLLSSSGQGDHCCTVRGAPVLSQGCVGGFFFPSITLNTLEGWSTSPAMTG